MTCHVRYLPTRTLLEKSTVHELHRFTLPPMSRLVTPHILHVFMRHCGGVENRWQQVFLSVLSLRVEKFRVA